MENRRNVLAPTLNLVTGLEDGPITPPPVNQDVPDYQPPKRRDIRVTPEKENCQVESQPMIVNADSTVTAIMDLKDAVLKSLVSVEETINVGFRGVIEAIEVMSDNIKRSVDKLEPMMMRIQRQQMSIHNLEIERIAMRAEMENPVEPSTPILQVSRQSMSRRSSSQGKYMPG